MPLAERIGRRPNDPLMRLMMPLSRGLGGLVPAIDRRFRRRLALHPAGADAAGGRLGRAGQFYTRAWAAFRHHSADMNTLIAVGTGAAFVFSLAVTLADDWFAAHGVEPHVYYEAVTWIIALILLGQSARGDGPRVGPPVPSGG